MFNVAALMQQVDASHPEKHLKQTGPVPPAEREEVPAIDLINR
jgi:hypothetical protein